MDILDYVNERLSTPRINLTAVAEGAGVKRRWLHALAHGEIPNPGYRGLKKVADYFLRVGDSLPLHSSAGSPAVDNEVRA